MRSPTPQPHLPWRLMPQSLHPSGGAAPCFGELFVGFLSYNSWCLSFPAFRAHPHPLSKQRTYISHRLTFPCPRGFRHFHSFYFGGGGGGSQEEVGMKAFFLSLSHLATSPNIVFWEQLFTLDCIGRLSISVCYCNWLCGILLYRQMIPYYTHPQHWTIKVVSNISLW